MAVASGVGVFVSFASLLVYTFGVFLKPLAEEFGWSREAVSAAFGIAAMTVAVCSPPLGYLLDRISPRRVIVPCLTIFGCAFASLSLLTPRLWHFYLVFVVLGIVGNGTAQMAYSRAVSSWFDRRRGAALARRHVGRRDWRAGAAAGRRSAHRLTGLAERVPRARVDGAPARRSDRGAVRPRASRVARRRRQPNRRRVGARGIAFARVLDCRDRAVLQLDRAERRDHAHVIASDGSWRDRPRRRARHLRHGRREPGRPAADWLAARPFLRGARVVRLARGGRPGHVRAFRR